MTADELLRSGRLFLTITEAAAILRIDERTCRRAAETGQIAAVKVGVQWRIPAQKLRELSGLSPEMSEAGSADPAIATNNPHPAKGSGDSDGKPLRAVRQ